MSLQKAKPALAALLCATYLASCVTPQDVRDKGAVASYASSKLASVVADCVVASWESSYGFTQPVTVRPTAAGMTIQIASGPNTMVLLDIQDKPSGGSESHYYKGRVWLEGRWDQGVIDCQ